MGRSIAIYLGCFRISAASRPRELASGPVTCAAVCMLHVLGESWRFSAWHRWRAVVTADFDDGKAKYAHFGEAEGNRRGDGAV